MYINDKLSIETQQKSYLFDRLANVKDGLIDMLQKQFYLIDDNAPKTKADFIDRVTKGLFMVNDANDGLITAEDWDDEENKVFYNNFPNSIHWRSKKPDREGYEEASKELIKAVTATKDQIMVGDAATGLKAVQDLEAWVPSNLPS